MLALPAPECDDDKVSVVLCGFCPAPTQKAVQPAGRAFHEVFEKPKLEAKRKGPRREEKKESDDEQEAPGDASWRKKRKEGGVSALKLGPLLEGEDLYALLEVPESASAEQIKKQYRKLVLQHHPDKKKDADPDAAAKKKEAAEGESEDALFIKIQEAYEVLTDQTKRRQYDSSLPFDEDIPDEVDEKLGFYGTFAPVFQKNGRWSTRYPVPDIGDENTDMSKVHKFYDFWLSFDSWRDFSTHDEYNLDDAEFREERRWMERQNQKIRRKYESDERKRILRLAETAERLDPRIRAEREEREAKRREEKERRAREKQEAEDAKRRAEEEKRLAAERAAAEKEEKERQERERRKQDKQAAKTLRQKLKKAVQSRSNLSSDEMDELQEMCLAMEAETEQIEDFCSRVEALPEKEKAKCEALVREELKQFRARRAEEEKEQARQREEARKKMEEEKAAAKEAEKAELSAWKAEELGVLAKGLQKFPGGTGGRWALICKMLNVAGYMRTEKEVIDKTKELSEGASLRSVGAQVAAEMNTFQAPSAKAKAKAAAAAPKAEPKAEPKAKAEASGGYPAADAKPAEAKTAEADWTPEQQKALEVALQKHPASLDKNERWRLIAADVAGKTKAECVARFKYIREQLSKKG